MNLRDMVRSVLLWLGQVLLSPLLLACWLEKLAGAGEHVFTFGAHLVSLLPGLPGSLLRKSFYMATLDGCDGPGGISLGAIVAHRSAVIHRDAFIGAYCVIGSATIGEGANVASRVSITSGRRQHQPGEDPGEPILGHVTIGDRAWIGEGSIIMADVGADAVVGAGSVVVNPVAPGAIVVGNPAREIAPDRTSTGARGSG